MRAVLLVAHGSRDPRAAATVTSLVTAVRRRLPETLVGVAYLDFSEPDVGRALTELAADGARQIDVVPLLFAPGYHLRVDLPSAIAEVRAGLPWLAVVVREPLGVAPEGGHPDLLVDALRARLRETVRDYDAVVLASAGSSDPAARAVVEQVADRWSRRAGLSVVPAHATAATPTVVEAVAALRCRGAAHVAVSELFIAPGRLPEAVRRAARSAGAVAVAEPLGVEAHLVDLLVRRATQPRPHSTRISLSGVAVT